MTNLAIRKALPEEYEAVKAFYDELIDHIHELEYGPAWTKGVYPDYEDLRRYVNAGELYIGLDGQRILAAMVLNEEENESYKNCKWNLDLQAREYMVIHLLGVMPSCTKQGLGRQMVDYAIHLAHIKYRALRLDVLKGNKAANYLYESAGFVMTDTIPMFYEDTGWTDFELYELVLKD